MTHQIIDHDREEAALDVGVEAFYEWDVDRKALKKTEPDLHIEAIRPTKHLEKYIKRKLYTLKCVLTSSTSELLLTGPLQQRPRRHSLPWLPQGP